MKRILPLWAVFVILVFSCSPKYKVEKIYHPSQDKNCLKRCDDEYIKCQSDCKKNYSVCIENSLSRAQKIYSQIAKEYEKRFNEYSKSYEIYLKQLENHKKMLTSLKGDYKFFSRMCSQYKDKEACRKKDQLKKKIKYLENNQPNAPVKPSEPSFEKILKKERQVCSCDCGCKELYDACYQSCGGSIEIKKICVENCD